MEKKNKIILASSSPQRKDLLKQLNLPDLECYHHSIDEKNYEYKPSISRAVVELAQMKAESVKTRFKSLNQIIISGDTVVLRAGKIFHKTDSKDEIKEYLDLLSGRKHQVFGGLCVLFPNGKIVRRLVKTDVYFNKIYKSEVTNEILEDGIGKSGGYAIQNYGSRFVKKIRGCYTNVVGISIPELYKILKGSEF